MEEQGGFRSGRRCIDQIYVLYWKELYDKIIGLEKGYDKVCRESVELKITWLGV